MPDAPPPSTPAESALGLPASPPASPAGGLDLDDVILAWAAVLPTLPMSTRSAVQEAQPIAIEDDVVVFGVSPRAYDRSAARLRRDAPEIRAALAKHLGVGPRFSVVKDESLTDSLTSRGPRPSGDTAAEEPPPPPPPEEPEEVVDLDELVDAPKAEAAVDSVSRLQADFGATVVDEIPRT